MPIAYSRLELGAPALECARPPGLLEDSSGPVLGADAAGLGALAPRPVRAPGTVDCGEEHGQRAQGRRRETGRVCVRAGKGGVEVGGNSNKKLENVYGSSSVF